MAYSDKKDRLARTLLASVLMLSLVISAFPAGFVQAEGEDGGAGAQTESASEPQQEEQSADEPEDTPAEETASEEEQTTEETASAEEDADAHKQSSTTNETAESEDGSNGDNGSDATDGTEGGNGTSTTEDTSNTESGDNGENGTTTASTTQNNGGSGGSGSSGEEGEQGNTGSTTSATSTSDGNPAIIETGNAGSSGGALNNANQSNTNVEGADNTEVDTDNTYTASSTATSSAQTGANEASDPDGAGIFTGNSDAFGMLVSLFNIVVTNSHGAILFLQNPLGAALDLSSQITDIFSDDEAVLGTSTPTCTLVTCADKLGVFNVVTDSIAEIDNTLIVRSGTGGNKAYSTGGPAVVETGDAKAFGSVINFGNLQIINSRYLVILLNNHGDLAGNIVVPPADFFKKLSGAATVTQGNSADIANQNDVDIVNNGSSSADSGTNTAQSTDKTLIETGDATAGADIQNFANQNSLGGRPICFIVSVGGKWNGKVVGLPENFNSEKTPFGEVICGAGQGASKALPDGFTASTTNYAKILNNVIVEAATGGNFASGTDAYIKTGSAEAFLQILNVVNQNIIGQDWIFALFTISGDWDGNLQFGTQAFWDEVNAQVASARSGGGGVPRGETSKLTITKSASKSTIAASSTVDYTIKIKNKGGPVYNALLVDSIYDEGGKKIHEQRWGLDTIPKGEEITINYTVFYNASTTPGTYTNEAFISGIDRSKNFQKNYAHPVDSPVATASVDITDAIGGVLSAYVENAPTCERYINTYMREGMPNDPVQVLKLQKFLSEMEKMDVAQTGVFDADTTKAVIAFQEKYAPDILGPWGAIVPTGFVYYTTQKKINELYCNNTTTFALSDSQVSEIKSFKNRFGMPSDLLPGKIKEKVEETPEPNSSTTVPEQVIPETNPIIVPPSDDSATSVERIIGSIKSRLFNLVDLISTGFHVVKTAAAATVEE